MELDMQNVSRTAAVIECPSHPRKNQQTRRFSLRDWACVLFTLTGLAFFTTTGAAKPPQTQKDNQPPIVSITSPSAGSIAKGIASVTVKASDRVGVAKVNLLVNGTLVATNTAAPYAFSWDSTKVANGTATLSARAYDAAGNSGVASLTVTVSNVSTDSQAPSVAISSPAASSTVKGVVSVAASATDNVGVAKVSLQVNGTLVASTTTAPYAFSWDSTKVANGTVTLSAIASDGAGNSATTSRTVTVSNVSTDSQAPSVAISSPAASSTVKGVVSVAASATDNVGVAKVSLQVNGTLVASTTTAPYAFSWDSTKVANGTVTLSAIASDGAGNSATTSRTVTVSNDTQAPSVAIGSPAPGSNVKGVVSVSVNATDNVGVTRVSLTANGGVVGSLTVPPYAFVWDSTKVSDGGVTLLATAYDAAGKYASAASNVTVQNVVVTAATYYVSSSSGSDGNAGTLAAPWRTLAKVSSSSSLFKPGDSIFLKRGDTWNEQFNIKDQAGASGTPITYGAYGSGALPTVDAQQARTFGVYMNNVSHIVVRDMRTINATANGFHIVAGSGNVSDVVVQGVVSERNARSGFAVEATPGVTDVDALIYRDAVAHLNGGAGFQAYNVSKGATGVHYDTCKATYNGQTSASHGFSTYLANNIHYHGVEAAFTNIDPATGLRNAFATGGEGIGIAFDDYVNNSSVEHSYSHDNAGSGVMLTHQSSNNVASYNVIARNGGIGLVINGWSAGSSNITVLNNTIYGNKNYGMVAWKPVSGLTIKNNIVVNNVGYGIGFSSTGITNYTVANNLAFGNTLGGLAYVTGATGTIAADPVFAAPASGDFSLQASSPAINAGLNLGSLYSLGLMKGSIWTSGVLLLDQGAAWDIGAFVYGP